MINKIVVFIILPLILIFCFFAWTLNSPDFLIWSVKKITRHNFPQIALKKFTVINQKFNWPSQFSWRGIKIEGSLNNQYFALTGDNLAIDNLVDFFLNGKSLQIYASKVDLYFDNLIVDDVFLTGDISRAGSVFIAVRFADISKDTLVASSGVFSFQMLNKDILVKNFTINAYGGTINGNVDIWPFEKFRYLANLKLKGLNSEKLRSLNDNLFTQIQGNIDGEALFSGVGGNLKEFSFNAKIAGESKIKAKLLSYLAQYIPPTKQRDQLQVLINNDGQVILDSSSFNVKTLNDHQLKANVRFLSRQITVDVNQDVDINLDGPVRSIFELLKNFKLN